MEDNAAALVPVQDALALDLPELLQRHMTTHASRSLTEPGTPTDPTSNTSAPGASLAAWCRCLPNRQLFVSI
jgi:hypothetical protein